MRNLDPAFIAALKAGVICPGILADLTFKSGTYHVWTGYAPLSFNGQTYMGVGSLASVGDIVETITVQADGTSVSLNGIDRALYAESLADIEIGAPATLWLALLNPATGQVLGSAKLFAGEMDKPTDSESGQSLSITINLENRMTNLQRPSGRRWTAADQQVKYPRDIAFSWVEALYDYAIKWQ